MTIKKLGHSCLLIKAGGLNILTDPGILTAKPTMYLTGIDVILISDEHPDHLDMPSVEALVQNNPKAKVITQKSVQKILADQGIASELLLDKQQTEILGIKFEGCGEKHAVLHSSIPQSDNTGYIIADKLFYPGDALTLPNRPIEILALPAAGPWLKISEVIDYALAVKPKFFFPVHDGLNPSPFAANMISKIVEKENIKMAPPDGATEF